jgi:hypothetical protein
MIGIEIEIIEPELKAHQALLVQQEQQVHKEYKAHKAHQAHQAQQEVSQAHKVLQDPLVYPVHKENED